MIVQSDPRAPRVVLVGPPGAGKSTIGRKLARELGVELYDTDAGIERETGRTIPEIFTEDGEPEFRRIEEQVVRRAILAERGVVSLGGGAVLSKDTRELLRNRTVVYLEISVAEGLRRTGASTQRPLLNGADPGAKYRELMRKRRPLYREVATVRVRTDGRSPGRVVRMIMAKLGMESVLPQEAEPDSSGTTPDVAAPKPQGSNRSRARRAARARAAARRRAAAAQADGAESAATERIKRTGKITAAGRITTDTATVDRPKPTGKIANGRTGSEGSGDPATPGSRARRTRARRARARALKQSARTESEPSTRE